MAASMRIFHSIPGGVLERAPSAANIAAMLRIAELLEKKDASQTDMAAELGVKQSTVSKWCSGKSAPHAKKLRQIAAYFEVDPIELFDTSLVTEEQRKVLIAMRPLGADDIATVEDVITAIRSRRTAKQGA